MSDLRTRFAPTPSGHLHLGNFYNLVWISIFSKKNNAEVGLRIDDYDRGRYRSHYVESIFEVLRLSGFKWSIGPKNLEDFEKHHSSVFRKPLYEEAMLELKSSPDVYWCTCTRKHQDGQVYDGHCRRLNLSEDSTNGDGLRAQLRFCVRGCDLKNKMGDFVLVDRQGEPSYQLSSVLDDLKFGYNFLIRGEDLRLSSMAQMELARALNKDSFLNTRFEHHGLLRDTDGAKLSKTQKSSPVVERLKQKNGLKQILEDFSDHYLLGIQKTKVPENLDEFSQWAADFI